jgi:TetR/AcrR family transcriptional repressor of nem operon
MDVLVESAEAAAEGGDATFLKHLQEFLSAEYRDDSLGGCPLVAMGSELARADTKTRRVASQGFQDLVDIIAKRNRLAGAQSAKADAIFTLSSMIGAVTMARIMDDPQLSDQILAIARKRLANRPRKARQSQTKSRAS